MRGRASTRGANPASRHAARKRVRPDSSTRRSLARSVNDTVGEAAAGTRTQRRSVSSGTRRAAYDAALDRNDVLVMPRVPGTAKEIPSADVFPADYLNLALSMQVTAYPPAHPT